MQRFVKPSRLSRPRKTVRTAFLASLGLALIPILSAQTGVTIANTFSRSTDVISGNPAAITAKPGTGQLGSWLGIPEDSGVRVGGLWLGDFNWLMHGGAKPGSTTWNSLVVAGINLDLEKLVGWNGGQIGAQFLRFDGQQTNVDAGVVQGYNSLPGPEPLNRSELYQLWVLQELYDGRLQIRVGKVVPTTDFGNVLQTIPVTDQGLALPAISGLLFTPIFVNPSQLGAIPGYYNSAWGVTVTATPTDWLGLAYGIYDGRLAQGVQTGIEVWPGFDGAYFQIAEANGTWVLGPGNLLGRAGVGGWFQSGQLQAAGVTDNGTGGAYAFVSQTVWQGSLGRNESDDGKDFVAEKPAMDQGIVLFGQFGANVSRTLPINTFVGAGVSAFGLVPGRIKDSFGAGIASSWLNERLFQRRNELMFQAYYQTAVFDDVFFEPAVSYIPNPGISEGVGAAWALTLRTTILF